MVRTSIIIPARNDADALPDAVRSIEAQRNVEIVDIAIAVGPSSDDTARVAQDLASRSPTIQIVENPAGSTPTALNLAIAAGTGDVVVRVDARSVLPSDYVANAVETLQATGAANVGAVQLPVGRTATERSIAAAMRSRLGSGGAKYRSATTRSQVDTAYLGVFRRDALEHVGGFDERFTRNQDGELNVRLRKAGYEVWLDPRLQVSYRPRGSFRALAKQYWQYGWWRSITVRTHPGSARLRQIVPPLAVAAALILAAAAAVLSAPLLLIPFGIYLLLVAIAALRSPASLSHKERCGIALAFVVIHVTWGAGFLVSMARGLAGLGDL